jgi:putative redox protein
METNMISGSVTLTQAEGNHRQFLASDNRGHHFILDDAAGNSGPKPIELIAIGLAGCTAFDVINILRKKRQEVTGYEVRVEADQRSEPPNVFTAVRLHHIVTGVNVSEEALQSAIHLSESKYCSVSAMLEASGAQIETTHEVIAIEHPVEVGA